jgi:signal transduction histidine kinase
MSISEHQALYSVDIHSDPRCTRQECKHGGLQSFAALPLRGNEEEIGVLGIGSRHKRIFEDEAAFLETLANQVAIALLNALLYEQIQDQAIILEKRVAERTVELEIAMEKAQEADRLKSAFLASMSHELRTPLNSIIGFTGILLQELAGPLNDEQSKQMGMVKSSAHHLLDLINDVLDISKIEAGQLEMAQDHFSLNESIDRVVKIVGPLAAKKGLTIASNTELKTREMVSDRRRVEQILINLVNNAVKFTDEGRVDILARVKDDQVEIRVQDTGIGMAPQDLGLLFQAFRQMDSGLARRYEGTGLGLSICKKLTGMFGRSHMGGKPGIGTG